jgi:peptidoglycan hydrolase CwlO-like protein
MFGSYEILIIIIPGLVIIAITMVVFKSLKKDLYNTGPRMYSSLKKEGKLLNTLETSNIGDKLDGLEQKIQILQTEINDVKKMLMDLDFKISKLDISKLEDTILSFETKFSEISTKMGDTVKVDKSLELNRIEEKVTEIINILKEISK